MVALFVCITVKWLMMPKEVGRYSELFTLLSTNLFWHHYLYLKNIDEISL